jgi:PAS domain S-box-containing protein
MSVSRHGESAQSRETPRLSAGARTTATTSYGTALQALIDANDQPVFALDPELRYAAFNRAHSVVMRALYDADITLGGRLPDYQTVAADRETSTANLARALAGERVTATAFSGEDDSRRCFEVVHLPQTDAAGTVVGVLVRAYDVTERRQAEEQLRESEDNFKYIFDYSPLGTSITLPDGEVRVNRAFCRMLGYTQDELEHTKWQDISHADDIDSTQAALESILSGRSDEARFVKRYLGKDGSIVWADVQTSLRRGEAGEALYFITTVNDITEQRLAQTSLRASEERYRELVDHMTSGVVVYEPTANAEDFIIREFNVAAQRIEGLDRDEVVGRVLTDVFPGVEDFGLLTVLRRVACTGEPEEFPTAFYQDQRLGSWRENHVYRLPSGEVVAVYEDATERVLAEREAVHAKELMERAEEIGHAGGWEYDVAADRVTWTDEVYRIHGVGPDFDPELLDRDVGFYAPESAPRVAGAFRRAVEGGEAYDLEVELDRADGSRIWVRTIGRPSVENGRVVRVIGNIMDITERVNAERELRESESRFRQLAESLPQLVWTCEPDGPCDFLSGQWVAYTGIPEAPQLGFGWLDQLHPDDRRPTVAAWEAAVAGGTDFHAEFRIRRHDGEYRWFDTQAVRLRDADGDTVKWFGSNTDITERRRAAEEILRLNAKLEQRVLERTAQLDAANKELEAFAYSVSHDLRAPLRHISGFASILAEDCADALDEEGRGCLDTIMESVREMGALIDELLQFSRVGRVEIQVTDVDMGELLAEALKPIREGAAGRAIEWSIGPLPHVLGDPVLLRQVWANLVDNAVKYSRDRSPARIEIGALDGDGDARACEFFVRDNGVGFDMQYADKLFGVFQRLHGVAEFEGIGIGLASVQRIVTRLGGRVWAEAELDRGATFSFTLQRPKELRC